MTRATANVLVAADIGADNLARIRAATLGRVTSRHCSSPAEVTAALGADDEVLFSDLMPDAHGPSRGLRWVQLMSAGIEVLRSSPVWSAQDVRITNASGLHVPVMSEYIIAMILQWAGALAQATTFKETRRWDDRLSIRRSPVAGKVLGIVGYGSVGRRTGRLAHALGMRTIAVRRTRDREPDDQYRWPYIAALDGGPEPAEVRTMEGLPSLLAESDFLAITLPLTPETTALIGQRELALMKRAAYIVNVSRGGIFDEAQLIRALAEGRIAGAALDVFEVEPPPPRNDLFGLPNVLMTPHISGVFDAYNDVATDLFIENLGRYVRGAQLLNLVSASRGY